MRTLRNAIERDTFARRICSRGRAEPARRRSRGSSPRRSTARRARRATPRNAATPAVTIAAGTSLDVIEMDAASQRGIDDIREIRERVVLQPVEGRYKVYILDEAHQLTDAAFNALLKLIEEPPPHLVFIFCTTDLAKMLPTVRSRCQTFVLRTTAARRDRRAAAPTSPTVRASRRPRRHSPLVARTARGSFRDAVSTLDQLSVRDRGARHGASGAAAARRGRGGGALPALRPRRSTATRPGALTFLEELADRARISAGSSPTCSSTYGTSSSSSTWARCPTRCRVTEETRERLRAQANQLGEATVLRLVRSARAWPSTTCARAATHAFRSSSRSSR